MKKRINLPVSRLLKLLYLGLFRSNDSPQKIALGLGLGVFLGIIPGTGPIAALVCAAFLRLNKAAALLGALLTNTWTSLIAIVLSIKIGAYILGLSWKTLYFQWQLLIDDFHWKLLFKVSFLKILLPVLLGYFVVAFVLGAVLYLLFLVILSWKKNKSKNKEGSPR